MNFSLDFERVTFFKWQMLGCQKNLCSNPFLSKMQLQPGLAEYEHSSGHRQTGCGDFKSN